MANLRITKGNEQKDGKPSGKLSAKTLQKHFSIFDHQTAYKYAQKPMDYFGREYSNTPFNGTLTADVAAITLTTSKNEWNTQVIGESAMHIYHKIATNPSRRPYYPEDVECPRSALRNLRLVPVQDAAKAWLEFIRQLNKLSERVDFSNQRRAFYGHWGRFTLDATLAMEKDGAKYWSVVVFDYHRVRKFNELGFRMRNAVEISKVHFYAAEIDGKLQQTHFDHAIRLVKKNVFDTDFKSDVQRGAKLLNEAEYLDFGITIKQPTNMGHSSDFGPVLLLMEKVYGAQIAPIED